MFKSVPFSYFSQCISASTQNSLSSYISFKSPMSLLYIVGVCENVIFFISVVKSYSVVYRDRAQSIYFLTDALIT